jgi:hypothetical protein
MKMAEENKANLQGGMSKGGVWTARIIKGIVILFMIFDGIGKLAQPEAVVTPSLALGFEVKHIAVMGILGLISTLLYAIPRTSFWGALLLTAYLGGAVAVQVRVDAPLFSNALFPVYVAVLAWAAVWIRDERVRKLVSLRG